MENSDESVILLPNNRGQEKCKLSSLHLKFNLNEKEKAFGGGLLFNCEKRSKDIRQVQLKFQQILGLDVFTPSTPNSKPERRGCDHHAQKTLHSCPEDVSAFILHINGYLTKTFHHN